MKKSTPKTALGRSKVIGQVAGKIAGKKIASQAKSLFLNSQDKNDLMARTHQEIAQMIFDGLVQLRGTALKLAQLFCGETGLLPQEYMKVFEQAHHRVPPLSAVLVRNVIRRELGADPSSLFGEFDNQAVAAASLGQVHRGRLKNGAPIAVKIQYPGIAETVMTDFKMARKILMPFSNTGLIINVLDELEQRLQQEIDYLAEQDNLNWFRQQILPSGIYLPQVYAEWTRSTVLTMEFVNGLHLDDWLATKPSQTRINQVAHVLFDFFIRSVFCWHRFHADPNFGNFMIDQHDQLAVIDFGAVKVMNVEDINFYRQLWCSDLDCDGLEILKLYQQRGAIIDAQDAHSPQALLEQAIRPYQAWIQKLIAVDHFDFKQHPDFVRQGHLVFSQQMFNPQMQNFDSSLTLVHRTLLGLTVIFQRLGAELNVAAFRDQWT